MEPVHHRHGDAFLGLLRDDDSFIRAPKPHFVSLYNASGLPALLHRRNKLSSLGKRKSEANSKVMFEKLVNRSMLGTRDQTRVSVTYTREKPQCLSSRHAGMFSEKGILP